MKSATQGASRFVYSFIYSWYARLATIVIPLVAIGALLSPLAVTDVNQLGNEHHDQFQPQINQLNEKAQNLGIPSETDYIEYSVNPLLVIVDTVTLAKGKSPKESYDYSVRWDLIIVFIGITFICLMM